MQKKRVLILIACVALLMAGFSGMVATATESNQTSKVAFKTPEDAINAYMAGIVEADFHKTLEACAINEMSENFKFDLYIDRLQAFVPFQFLAPSSDPLYAELNKAQISSQIANQVKILAYSLLSTENVTEGITIRMDLEKATNFMKAVDPKRLAKLEVKKIALPNKTLMSNTRYLDNAAKLARTYGADELTERVVLLSFEQNYYFLGFTLLRYGENWKISSQNSALANTSALGAPKKTTVAEFESMINGK